MKTPITDDIFAIGVADHGIDLFEGQFEVPDGMRYNSYAILDEKVAVVDTVDARFLQEWLDNMQEVLGGRQPDYLVVQHMEPDHSANIQAFMELFPATVLVASAQAFAMMQNFFGTQWSDRRQMVGDGDTLALGRHVLTFVAAPMVHWPEVLVTYDATDKVLFSADAFGTFGAYDDGEGEVIAEVDPSSWTPEARRYYFGIVAKYGAPVQRLLAKAATLELGTVCPLHGPVLSGAALANAVALYQTWASYAPEAKGILVAYTSVYGHTRAAAHELAEGLRERGCPLVLVRDLARCDPYEVVAQAFRLDTLVLATTTYNTDAFPAMREFLMHLTDRAFQNRLVALVENGSWAPGAARAMRVALEKCRDLRYAAHQVCIHSALARDSRKALGELADELAAAVGATPDADAESPATDPAAFNNIGYGLYVAVTRTSDGRDNGCIVNAVSQVAATPARLAISISKRNYTHHLALQTERLALNCLDESAPFEYFRRFGFQCGRGIDKFEGLGELGRMADGLAILPEHVNAVLSLRVEQYMDLGSHGLFVCAVEEARVLSSVPSMTYAYYHQHVKPKPAPLPAPTPGTGDNPGIATGKKVRWVCKICGFVYEGEELPPDYVCPLCKHPASDFERIEG